MLWLWNLTDMGSGNLNNAVFLCWIHVVCPAPGGETHLEMEVVFEEEELEEGGKFTIYRFRPV
jgi:hypothetical protein